MPTLTLPDLFLVVPLAAIAVLLIMGAARDNTWKRRIQSGDDPNARLKLYSETMLMLWLTALVAIGAWLLSGRSMGGLGFDMGVGGWRSGLAWGAALAAVGYMAWTVFETGRSRQSRDSVRRQVDAMGGLEMIRARTPAEHDRFLGVAITAGITEEIIFRGFLIGALALAMPLWVAAIVSIAAFTLGHLYQGASGLMRVLPVAIVLTILYLVGGSIWPVMIIHAALDLTGGFAFRFVDQHAERDLAASKAA